MTLAPDDVRHGTWRGYARGCRDDDCGCRADHARRRNVVRSYTRKTGHGLTVDSLPARRKTQALQCLGWSMTAISLAMGKSPNSLYEALRNDRIRLSTHRAVDDVYRRLCMTVSDSPRADRVRARARAAGWFPPLAWTNIDDPDEDPAADALEAAGEDGYDWVVVARVLAGDKMPTTDGEREAIWRARAWNHDEFERLTGGNAHRTKKRLGPSGGRAAATA